MTVRWCGAEPRCALRPNKRGLPVEYVLFPDEGHGWRKTANRITSTVAITKFFVKYLK